MPAKHSFDYAIIRVVPHVERGEYLNAGVILSCGAHRHLDALVHLDATRLLALAPDADAELIAGHLATIPRICRGESDAGPIAHLPRAERFDWLTAPRSTIIQTSPIHTGLCADPAAMLEWLMMRMVVVGGKRVEELKS